MIADVSNAQLVHHDSETNQAYTRAETDCESKNGLFVSPEGDHTLRISAVKLGAASKSATESELSQQMCFNWS